MLTTYIATASLSTAINPVAGQVVIDPNSLIAHQFDGKKWVQFSHVVPTVDQLCEQHPGLAQLKSELDAAQAKFDAYLALVKENQ